MKVEVNEFSSNLEELENKLNTARDVFTNVTKVLGTITNALDRSVENLCSYEGVVFSIWFC